MTIRALALILVLAVSPSAFAKTVPPLDFSDSQAQRRLAALPDPDCDKLRTEALACLACNIYHEARSEPLDGKRMVGKVTMNRVGSALFPDTVCAVVWQRHGRSPQFSWTHDGRSDRVHNAAAWREAVEIAALMIRDHYDPHVNVPIGGRIYEPDSMWFHAGSIRPRWTARLQRVAQVGNHIVYRDR